MPATPDGQSRYVVDLAKVLAGVPEGRGAGVIWWGTEYQRVNGVATAGFEWRWMFDSAGNVLPAAGALGQLTAPVRMKASLTGPNMALTWPLSGIGHSLRTRQPFRRPRSGCFQTAPSRQRERCWERSFR